MNRKVLFIYERKLSELPPLLTLIQLLKQKGYSITVTVSETENQYNEDGVKQYEFLRRFKLNNKITRLLNRKIYGKLFFKYEIPKLIDNDNYDIIWVIISHLPNFLFSFNEKKIINSTTYCSIFELYDIVPILLEKIGRIARIANKVIVPELNRAHILRSYLKLDTTPTVLPNKPIDLPELKNQDIKELVKRFEGKKVVLYQGHISPVRNVEPICKAIDKLENFVFVLMGSCYDGYADKLIHTYHNIVHIPFIPPPMHLEFTSKAYIGIVTYEHFTLNEVFCAPNKIWEYSGYGLPMICSDIPGLIYTVEQNKCGVCVNINDEDAIFNAISIIESNYNQYRENAKLMFDSMPLQSILDKLLADTKLFNY